MDKLFNLESKTAIVTGASRGLGKAMAQGLAEAGANVAVSDISDCSKTVAEIKKSGQKAIALKTDVSKKSDIKKMVEKTIKEFGKIDILVNNAGIFRTAPAEKIKEEDWDKIMAVNLKGEFLCAQEAGKQMIKQKSGKIVNIASVAGLSAFAGSAAYNASKAGIILLTKTLAVEWGKYNIQANAVCPGSFATEMTKDFLKDKDFMQMIKTRTALARYGEPRELIGTVVYLSSKASDYVTGHALTVDGGWTAGL